MVTYHRWLILPMVQHEESLPDGGTRTVTAPKYVFNEDRLDGYSSGGPFTPAQVNSAGYSHLTAHNNATEWRVVVAWGEGTDAWQALNEIHANHHDTETLADHGQDVKPVMDDRFGPGDWTIDASALDGSENSA